MLDNIVSVGRFLNSDIFLFGSEWSGQIGPRDRHRRASRPIIAGSNLEDL